MALISTPGVYSTLQLVLFHMCACAYLSINMGTCTMYMATAEFLIQVEDENTHLSDLAIRLLFRS